MHNNSCIFQIAFQLEEERSKHSEYTKKHRLERKKYKKLISQNHKRQNNNKPVADVNNASAADYPQGIPQGIEVVYNEEVTAVENNTTIEDEFDFNRTIEDEVSWFLVLFFQNSDF